MKRVIIICEGGTEQEFCKTMLTPHFTGYNIFGHYPIIKYSAGGIIKWGSLKQEIEIHLKKDSGAHVTLLIDYYGLCKKHGFPAWERATAENDKNRRMDILEREMANDIDDVYRYRFIPYIQLHEFEGLLFNNFEVFTEWIPENKLIEKEELRTTLQQYDNPEMINDSQQNSPSHRLSRIVKGYQKILDGNILAHAIGLGRIRRKSPRFNKWIKQIEQLSEEAGD